MNLANLTAEEKLALALDELRDAGDKLNRMGAAAGARTLRIYEELSGNSAEAPVIYADEDEI